MGQTTNISWAHSSFGAHRGCLEISPACDSCYAREMAKRNPKILGKWGSEADGGTRVVAAEDYWKEPPKWNKQAAAEGVSRRVFLDSMADVFESWNGLMLDVQGRALLKPYLDSESQPENWIGDYLDIDGKLDRSDMQGWRPVTMGDVRQRVFDLIDKTPNLNWLLLTKRPENIVRMIESIRLDGGTTGRIAEWEDESLSGAHRYYRNNCWLGTTVENQHYANQRINELLKARILSPVLWLSAEPLLGPIDLQQAHMTQDRPDNWPEPTRVDWCVVGCESGSKARPTELEWVRSLRDQCLEKGVAFFVKQLMIGGKLRKNIEDFPSDLQIQQVPVGA